MNSAAKLTRYHHASHPHKLFQTLVRDMAIFCDNQNCKRRLHHNEVDYVCFRCNFDLCAQCMTLPTETASVTCLHESDDDINEDVLFVPERAPVRAKTVRVCSHRSEEPGDSGPESDGENGSESNGETVPEHATSSEPMASAEHATSAEPLASSEHPPPPAGPVESATVDVDLTFGAAALDPLTTQLVNQLLPHATRNFLDAAGSADRT